MSYFDRQEVSNSDLGWLQRLVAGYDDPSFEKAALMGNMVDFMLTETDKVNYYTESIEGLDFSKEEWHKAKKMRDAFRKDEYCKIIIPLSKGQVIKCGAIQFDHCGVQFELRMRCKFDLWMEALQHGGDIKTTAAATYDQFVTSIDYFNWDRQRVLYMRIAGSEKDMLIGISKKNYKVFKVPIKKGDSIYSNGNQKLTHVAFEWWKLFGDTNPKFN